MNFVHKTLGLLLASLALGSCGGGGGDGHGAFEPPQSGHIVLTPQGGSRVLPLNSVGASWSPASPFTNAVDVHWTNADGTPVSGHDVSCSVDHLSVMSIHILDDASTPDDESAVDWGNIQVHSDTGHAICWVFSTGQAGTATLSVGGVDPITNATLSASVTFTVENASGPLPASITMAPLPTGVYLSGSGGNQNSVLTVQVLDGGGQPVPDPSSGNTGFDNVLLEIVTNPSGDARLSANSVSGAVSGNSVATHTINGVATAGFQAGTVEGPIQIRATADRSDNNVTNGISDPVSTTAGVIVSDGKLYSLEITSPVNAPSLPGITINSVSGSVEVDPDTLIPPDPDATLSLTVTALGTDRQGNPVLPGTAIRFGAVDEPVGAPGSPDDNVFLLSGLDGNPQEGGTLFTAPTGHFTTGGGGAGPGDALIVFGKVVEGNADLESALSVQSVNSATSLNVSSVFNRNNTTGTVVDYGPVLPYLIGRAQHGNISSPATTNDLGIAHTTLNYTVNSVGNAVAIWAQGDGIDRVTNGQRRVTDAGTLVYPGVAPATIVAFPDPILGDTTQVVTVCVTDALGIQLRGYQVGFSFSLNGGTGSVDGTPNTGTFASLTGLDGCAVGTVVTSGVPASTADGNSGTLNLSAAGQTTSIDIVVQVATLQVSPNSVFVPAAGVTKSITVTALTANGTPVPGALITGTCTASGGDSAAIALTPGSATTNGSGSAVFSAAATGFVAQGTDPTAGTGQCVFSTEGSNSATVTFTGTITCSDFSPPTCGGN